MIKILIIGATCSKNRGSAAMLISTVKTLRSFISDLDFTVLSPYHELDLKNCSPHNINVQPKDLIQIMPVFFNNYTWLFFFIV